MSIGNNLFLKHPLIFFRVKLKHFEKFNDTTEALAGRFNTSPVTGKLGRTHWYIFLSPDDFCLLPPFFLDSKVITCILGLAQVLLRLCITQCNIFSVYCIVQTVYLILHWIHCLKSYMHYDWSN